MPDQAGTWLGTRRAETCAAIWMDAGPVPGSDLRQRAGAGRFRTAPTCRGNRRSSPSLRAVRTSGRAQTGQCVTPGLRSCAKG